MTHPWKSTDEKRTIVFSYSPGNNIIKYLNDMRDLINRAIINAYAMAKSNNNQIPSPIILRRSLKNYYDNNIDYAKHHINPACRTAIAILRSYKKNNNGELRIIKAIGDGIWLLSDFAMAYAFIIALFIKSLISVRYFMMLLSGI